jgi:hypothetical protein
VAALLGFALALPQFPIDSDEGDGSEVDDSEGLGSQGGGSLSSLAGSLTSLTSGMDFARSTSNDLIEGPCKDILLIVARGSLEPGNIVGY